MMNLVALGFLLSSLVTAVVWSPEAPQKHQSMGVATFKPGEEKQKEVLMREGRRVIVMEYEKEGLLDSAVGTADQYAKPTGENVRHKAGEVGDEARHLIKTGVDTIKATAGKAKDTVKTAADKTSHTVKDSASSALHTAGTVKDRAEEAAKDEAHHMYDKTGQVYESAKEAAKDRAHDMYDNSEQVYESAKEAAKDQAHDVYESAKDKVSQTLGSVKDAGLGVKGAVSSHLSDVRQGMNPDRSEENAEDSKNAKTGSVGVGETLKDISQRVAEKFASSKKEAENVDSSRESSDIYGSAKGKISDVGEKIKEEGEQALKTAGEKFDSAKESIKRAEDYVQRAVEDAKESLRVKEDHERQQAGLRSNVEKANVLYKFRQAVDEVYRLSPELLEAAGKLENQFFPLLITRDPKDGARTRTANLVKETAVNLTTGETSKGYYDNVLSRFRRWVSGEGLMTGLRLVHLLAFATVYGSSMWVNFIGGHVLARTFPRQQFGFLQSKLYPVYFKTVACGLAICLLAHSALHSWQSAKAERWQEYNLIFSLLLTLANMLYFEPRATKALFERLRMEKEEGRGRDLGDMTINADNLSISKNNTTTHDHHVHSGSCVVGDDVNCKMAEVSKRLSVLHRYSSALNLLCMASLTWHLAYLSSYLKI